MTTAAAMTTAAVNAAIASLAPAGGNVWLQPGILDLSAGPIIGASNVTIHGVRGATIFRVPFHTVLNFYAVNALGCDNFNLVDITFDMGDVDPPDDNWPTSASGAVLVGSNGVSGGNACSIRNCEIINMGRYGFVARGGTRNLRIRNNDIARTAPSGAPNIGIMLRKDGGVLNVTPQIVGNETSNTCGFGGAAWNGLFDRNIMRGSGFGANFELDQDPNCIDNIISNNNCSALTSLPPGLGGDGMEIWGVRTALSNNKTNYNAGWGLTIAERDCKVIGHMSAYNARHGIWLDGSTPAAAGHNAFLDGCKTLANGGSPYFIDPGIVGTVLGVNDFR